MKPSCRQIESTFRKNEAVCATLVSLFQQLSNKGRFRIVCVLAQGEFCVNDITEVVGGGKISNISQQLKMLTLSGILQRRRDKRHIFYSLRDKRVGRMIRFLQEQFLDGDTL
jgi:DNA-binding transcriptional ArsR family regulator